MRRVDEAAGTRHTEEELREQSFEICGILIVMFFYGWYVWEQFEDHGGACTCLSNRITRGQTAPIPTAYLLLVVDSVPTAKGLMKFWLGITNELNMPLIALRDEMGRDGTGRPTTDRPTGWTNDLMRLTPSTPVRLFCEWLLVISLITFIPNNNNPRECWRLIKNSKDMHEGAGPVPQMKSCYWNEVAKYYDNN